MSVWQRFRRWYSAPFPAELGRGGPLRAITIPVVFQLHSDGKVYKSDSRGVRRVDDSTVVAMVHEEYRQLVRKARTQARLEGFRKQLRQSLKRS